MVQSVEKKAAPKLSEPGTELQLGSPSSEQALPLRLSDDGDYKGLMEAATARTNKEMS